LTQKKRQKFQTESSDNQWIRYQRLAASNTRSESSSFSDGTADDECLPLDIIYRVVFVPAVAEEAPEIFNLLWDYETNNQDNTSTYTFLNRTTTSGLVKVGTAMGNCPPAANADSNPKIPTIPGDTIRVSFRAGAQTAHEDQARTLQLRWYNTLGAVNNFATTTINIPPSSNGDGPVAIMDEESTIPTNANYLRLHTSNGVYFDNLNLIEYGPTPPQLSGSYSIIDDESIEVGTISLDGVISSDDLDLSCPIMLVSEGTVVSGSYQLPTNAEYVVDVWFDGLHATRGTHWVFSTPNSVDVLSPISGETKVRAWFVTEDAQ